MDTVKDIMNNNINILSRINYLEEQIALRETIPYSERTEKQLIKLDNLLYELKQLSNM